MEFLGLKKMHFGIKHMGDHGQWCDLDSIMAKMSTADRATHRVACTWLFPRKAWEKPAHPPTRAEALTLLLYGPCMDQAIWALILGGIESFRIEDKITSFFPQCKHAHCQALEKPNLTRNPMGKFTASIWKILSIRYVISQLAMRRKNKRKKPPEEGGTLILFYKHTLFWAWAWERDSY